MNIKRARELRKHTKNCSKRAASNIRLCRDTLLVCLWRTFKGRAAAQVGWRKLDFKQDEPRCGEGEAIMAGCCFRLGAELVWTADEHLHPLPLSLFLFVASWQPAEPIKVRYDYLSEAAGGDDLLNHLLELWWRNTHHTRSVSVCPFAARPRKAQ